MPKAADTNQVAAVYGLLLTAPWNTSLIELDVLRIRQWFEDERRRVSKMWEARLEESRTLDRKSAQYRDDAAALTKRAKGHSPDFKGSLSHSETVHLQQQKKKLDEYREGLQCTRHETERASIRLLNSFKDKIGCLQRLVHDKTAEIAKELKQQGIPKEEIEEKIAVSRIAVREMTSALEKEFLPEEAQQVSTLDSPLKQPS